MKLKDVVAEYQSLIEYLDLAEQKFGVYPSEKDLKQVALLARLIREMGGKP
jgi:hypothetical protein